MGTAENIRNSLKLQGTEGASHFIVGRGRRASYGFVIEVSRSSRSRSYASKVASAYMPATDLIKYVCAEKTKPTKHMSRVRDPTIRRT
jgi:hypothetical protein